MGGGVEDGAEQLLGVVRRIGEAGRQRADWCDRLETEIVAPLEAEADARRRAIAARAAATKVDFFTVAREAGS